MKKYIWILVVLVVIGGVVWLIRTPGKAGAYDELATCIKDKGAIFYGAFWCPHCQNQKAMFGRSAKLLPYVECSTPDGQSQLPICNQAKVEGYPTWVFPDGTRESGEVSLERLAEVTSCQLPK
jgi:thiol-disulfide isomerase/thioredoxin